MRHTTTIQSDYHQVFRRLFSVCLACMSALPIYSLSYSAGITTDGSMGTAKTLTPTGQAYTIPADLGQQKGTNLFHSFGDFNVNTGYSATFTGTAGTTNVIGRVTGGSPSSIDGRLACDIAGANLWLLNPFGILFGSNATLDVKGSFHASTADYLQLSDGGVFYTNPSKTSKLTSAPPSAFGFLSSKPAEIYIKGSTLKVPDGQSLSIVGGDIRIEDGHLVAPGSRVNLASHGSPGTVEIVSDGLKVEAPNGLGDINISNSMKSSNTVSIDVSGVNSGDISGSVDIFCKTFSLNHSSLLSYNFSKSNKGGIIQLIAEESAFIDNLSVVGSRSYGEGAGGDIDIQTGYLALTNGGQISASTSGSGDGGNVSIKAKGISIDGGFETINGAYLSKISCETKSGSTGNTGNLNIDTESLILSNGGQIAASTLGSGNGRDITIKANNVFLDNGEILSDSYGHGKGGNVNIHTESLNLTNGGKIWASTYGTGAGGDITINATNILIDRSSIMSFSDLSEQTVEAGDAGDIIVNADSIKLLNGGRICGGAMGGGDSGNIKILANDISIDGGNGSSSYDFYNQSGIFFITTPYYDLQQMVGSIYIQADSLKLTRGGRISADNLVRGFDAFGNAGYIDIKVKDLLIDGQCVAPDHSYLPSTISCQASYNAVGTSLIYIHDANSLKVTNGGMIIATNNSKWSESVININAHDILIDGGFSLFGQDINSGIYCGSYANSLQKRDYAFGSGHIYVQTYSLKISNGGVIAAGAGFSGTGRGGSIDINAGTGTVLIDGGFIEPDGFYIHSGIYCGVYRSDIDKFGKIDIQANSLKLTNGGLINADAWGGSANGGLITITANDVLIDGGSYDFQGIFHQSAISSLVQSSYKGNGGQITVHANSLTLKNGGIISADSNSGYAGIISIEAEIIFLSQNSSIATEANQGDGGNIRIHSGLIYLSDSQITATVDGGPQTTGGNIQINSPEVVLKDSRVIANAYEGKGGSIGITADTYLSDWTSTVSASSTLGINGQVDINSPPVNLSGLLSPLPTAFVDISELLANDCETRYKHRKTSSLFVRGRDALPAQPGDLWPSPVMMQ